jgi:diguanylate cyclase (GGDEF)-like protein/PAS domain S-box-containing protein
MTAFDAFDASPAPMWVFDVESLRIVAVNRATLDAYGYTREELLGLDILELRPPAEREALARYVRLPRSERINGRVWIHRHRDGGRMHVAISSRDIELDGRPARLVVACDVSEIERAQERMRLLARAVGDAAYDYDVVDGSVWFSDNFATNFAFDAATAPADVAQWMDGVHPQDIGRISASFDAALAGTTDTWSAEYRYRCGDGSYTDVLDRGYIQRDTQGRALRMVGGMIDLRPQRQLSTRLRLLERAVDAAGTGILIADATRDGFPIVHANPAFESITGHALEAIRGRPFGFLHPADDERPGVREVHQALREMREAQVSLQGTRADGRPFSYDFHVTPMRDAQGQVTHLMGVMIDTSERQRHAQQLAWRTTHDVLTGMPSRHLLLERATAAVQRAQEQDQRVAVLIVDLDEFKLVNDEMGHAAGDKVLCEVSLRLQRAAGSRATIARSVGDEFAILVEGSDDMHAELLASQVHAALAEPIQVGEHRCNLTACVGYSHFPDDAASAESLLRSAEMAMYQAKKQGRNCTVAYRAGRMPVTTGKLQLLQELREGLERKEFRLLFQPLFSADLRLVALEALVRWEHPRRGLLPPSEFISICEESGLIVELGRRVLQEAARHHEQLAARGLGHVRISVNVSAMQFEHGLLEDVTRVIEEFQLPRGALELELTESVILEDPERAAQVMAALSDLGVTLAIDDFGVGYSSLSYLKRLPIHRLKIDRSFVNDLESDVSDRSICEAVIALARTLRLGVVAEGVESAFQRDWLRTTGAGELQGYLFARPLPFNEATLVAPLIGDS